MKIKERDGAAVRPQYVNSFRVFAGNNEVVLEVGQVDLVKTLETAEKDKEPEEMVLDVKGRYVIRPDQVAQLINSLVGTLSQPQQQKSPKPGEAIER
jgi:hypothetical protein